MSAGGAVEKVVEKEVVKEIVVEGLPDDALDEVITQNPSSNRQIADSFSPKTQVVLIIIILFFDFLGLGAPAKAGGD